MQLKIVCKIYVILTQHTLWGLAASRSFLVLVFFFVWINPYSISFLSTHFLAHVLLFCWTCAIFRQLGTTASLKSSSMSFNNFDLGWFFLFVPPGCHCSIDSTVDADHTLTMCLIYTFLFLILWLLSLLSLVHTLEVA